jgi:serine/threonine protein kinase
LITERCVIDLFDFIDAYHNIIDDNISAVILKQIFQGINHTWSHGIVHRDLKPENILMNISNTNLEVKICDFGLCQKVIAGEITNNAEHIIKAIPSEREVKQSSVDDENNTNNNANGNGKCGVLCNDDITIETYDDYSKIPPTIPITPIQTQIGFFILFINIFCSKSQSDPYCIIE